MSLLNKIEAICGESEFRQEMETLLTEMCEVDTTPNSDVAVMREAEAVVFDQLRKHLDGLTFARTSLIEKAIPPSIQDHPAFSKLHFTKTEDRPEGLPAEEVYRDRHNLLLLVDGEESDTGVNTAINAHIDVIAPYFPPRAEGDRLFGRGTVDDKGNVVAIIAALKIIDRLAREGDLTWKNKLTAMFVVEEETGGNGSLALALDRELKERYDSILVMEVAGSRVYPANRGAAWFKCVARREQAGDEEQRSLVEAVASGIMEMQREGGAIKGESDHPLFPHRPVQTCNGMLGPFGEHPSRICGEIRFRVNGLTSAEAVAAAREAMDRGLKAYIADFGDKTQVTDPVSGKPKVDHHLDIAAPDDSTLAVTVWGSTGHMGSLVENDAAITKWAYLVEELIACKLAGTLSFTLEIEGCDASEQLVLEGGQGFLPTHTMEDVQQRIAVAFETGVQDYLIQLGQEPSAVACSTTYDKLHNAAFDGDPEHPSMKRAIEAGFESGMMAADTPIRGWDVSCDSRLFATEYPGLPVITSGVGDLAVAHADNEHLCWPEFWPAVAFTVLFLLRETESDIDIP